MFSWICPKCGTEVPPSQSECPRCHPVAVQAPAQVVPPPMAVPPPAAPTQVSPAPSGPLPPPEARRPPKQGGILFAADSGTPADYAPPPPAYPQQPGYANYPPPAPPYQQQHQAPYVPPYAAPPAPSSGMPTWLLMLLVALGVGGLIAGLVYFKSRASQPSAAERQVEAAPAAAEADASASPAAARYAKILEITGFRLNEERQKPQVRMLVVNHSGAQIGSLMLKVTLSSTDGKELGTASADVAGIDPLGSLEVTAPLKTSLRAYELPDWQFVRAQFSVSER